jgi:aryl-alcohol dehydrogenase-like predicted oxidoreductase
MLVDASVGTVRIGDYEVRRLGFGAMRISGARNAEGVRDRHEARQLVREIRDRGVNFFDAANIYGYGECEEILAEALHPYATDLLIGTKAGFRPGKLAPGQRSLPPLGRPEHIRAECDKSLRRLRVDRIDLYQVHVPDPDVPYEDTVGAFVELQQQGKIRHIGVSNVTLDQLAQARALCAVVSVQNAYGLVDRASQDVLDECARTGTPFLPHSPLHGIGSVRAADAIAERHGATAQQVAIAWLLQRSPVMTPIPGTSQLTHAHANVDAAWLHLTAQDVAELATATNPTG